MRRRTGMTDLEQYADRFKVRGFPARRWRLFARRGEIDRAAGFKADEVEPSRLDAFVPLLRDVRRAILSS
jgi:hypothetical protein